MFRMSANGDRDCDGVCRRTFLEAGVLGVGGLTLPDLLRIHAAQSPPKTPQDTSVILFWLSGGPGHMETWDPKPEAVSQFRGPLGAIIGATLSACSSPAAGCGWGR